MKNTVLLPSISSDGLQSLESPTRHIPISMASDFIQMVLLVTARSVLIVLGWPVFGFNSLS